METFKKVFINGDKENLPKKADYYDVVDKHKTFGRIKYNNSHADMKYWLKDIDWYLQPLPEVETKTAEEILKSISKGFNRSDFGLAGNRDSEPEYWHKKQILEAMQEYANQLKVVTDEEIENGITVLAKLHAKQSVGDWATGYVTGAKWLRDKSKGVITTKDLQDLDEITG